MSKLEEGKPFPGPYRIGKNRFDRMNVYADDPEVGTGEKFICQTRGWGHMTGAGAMNEDGLLACSVQDATARLLATSWEMQEVLREVDVWMNKIIDDYSCEIHDKVINVLKKANDGT